MFFLSIVKYLASLLLTLILLESTATAVDFLQGHELTVAEGNPLQLDCVSTSSNIQIFKDGDDLENSPYLEPVEETREDGLSSRRFYKEKAELSDEASYRCTTDEATNIEVIISPILPAKLTPENGTLAAPEGGDLTLTCDPEEYQGHVPTHYWIRKETAGSVVKKNLNDCSKDDSDEECCSEKNESGCKYWISNDNSLVILATNYNDSGQYICYLINPENPGLTYDYEFTVTVYRKLTIGAPDSVTVIEGEIATLECTIEGHPLPLTTWLGEDGQSIVESNTTIITLVEESDTKVIFKLTLENVKMEQGAEYTCRASNQFEEKEKSIILEVTDEKIEITTVTIIVIVVVIFVIIVVLVGLTIFLILKRKNYKINKRKNDEINKGNNDKINKRKNDKISKEILSQSH